MMLRGPPPRRRGLPSFSFLGEQNAGSTPGFAGPASPAEVERSLHQVHPRAGGACTLGLYMMATFVGPPPRWRGL